MEENTRLPEGKESLEDSLEEGFVALMDEEGNEHRFEHLDSFEFNGEVYVCLASVEEEDDPDEVLIFTLSTDEEGKESLTLVEDEAELDMAFDEFKRRMQDTFDFE